MTDQPGQIEIDARLAELLDLVSNGPRTYDISDVREWQSHKNSLMCELTEALEPQNRSEGVTSPRRVPTESEVENVVFSTIVKWESNESQDLCSMMTAAVYALWREEEA